MTVEQRLARLERQNQRLNLGLLAILAGLAGLVCLAATNKVAKVVRAQRFELTDWRGVTRGDFRAVSGGGPTLDLCDTDGKARAQLMIAADGSSGLILSGKKKVRAGLAAWYDGTVELALLDLDGNGRADLALDTDGHPSVDPLHKNGKPRAALGTTDLVSTSSVATQPTAESSPVLFDREGKVLWKAP